MGLKNRNICRKCGTEEEKSVHILCECDALASLTHIYLRSYFLDPENVRKLNTRDMCKFAKGKVLL